jgi:hypothetical protein
MTPIQGLAIAAIPVAQIYPRTACLTIQQSITTPSRSSAVATNLAHPHRATTCLTIRIILKRDLTILTVRARFDPQRLPVAGAQPSMVAAVVGRFPIEVRQTWMEHGLHDSL